MIARMAGSFDTGDAEVGAIDRVALMHGDVGDVIEIMGGIENEGALSP